MKEMQLIRTFKSTGLQGTDSVAEAEPLLLANLLHCTPYSFQPCFSTAWTCQCYASTRSNVPVDTDRVKLWVKCHSPEDNQSILTEKLRTKSSQRSSSALFQFYLQLRVKFADGFPLSSNMGQIYRNCVFC